jgi:hypothetical protein
VNGDFSGLGIKTWSTGPYDGDVYKGNLKHFDLAFCLKLSLVLIPNQLTIAPVLECNPVL